MPKKHSKGFTLIELLVVIAIIGILATIVITALNQARNKGNDAKIKANLASAKIAAEVVYDDNNGNYDNVCSTAAPMAEYLDEANYPYNDSSDPVICNENTGNDAYAMSADLSDDASGAPSEWCVDSVGNSRRITSSLGTGTVCP